MTIRKEFVEYPFELSTAVKRTEDKGNRIRQRVKSIRLGEYTDQFIRMRVIFPEGDERILRPGEVITVSEVRDFFTLEWSAQSGKTVLLEVSDEIVLQASPVPNNQLPSDISTGFTPNLQNVTNVPQLLIPANANRVRCHVENRGTVTYYLGDLATLNDASFKTKAIVLPVGAVSDQPWKSVAGLYVRTDILVLDANGFYTFDEYK